jgi:hypothetical protein
MIPARTAEAVRWCYPARPGSRPGYFIDNYRNPSKEGITVRDLNKTFETNDSLFSK